MIEQSIEVDVPVRTAYDQWTQFEEFPSFMDGVEEVRQIDDTHLHWVAQIAGQRREWEAEITEQRPDERVAWKSIDGKDNAGVVTFHRLDENRTRIMVQMAHDAEGILESVGAALNLDERRVKADLERFKQLIERRGAASGSWRGHVQAGDTVSPEGTAAPRPAVGQGAASGEVVSTDALAPDEPGRLA